MSRFHERQRIEAEVATLDGLLKGTSPRDVVGRIGLTSQLEEARSRLEALDAQPKTQAELALVFGGRPVAGGLGIDADFGTKALAAFQKAVSANYAARIGHNLGQRGPVRDADQATLHITGVIHGSFGFVLEEVDPLGIQLVQSALKDASQSTMRMIDVVASDSDGAAAEILEEIEQRQFTGLRNLIKILYEADASLTIIDPDTRIELTHDNLSRAYRRVANAEIEDEELTIEGMLLGVLPATRRFELQSGEVLIRGKVSPAIGEDYLRLIETEPLVGNITAVIHKRTLSESLAATRESYTLLRIIKDGQAHPPIA